MGWAVHKTTLQYIKSVNTPDYDPAVWFLNPDLTAVLATPQKYWKNSGGSIVPMTATEQQAIDDSIAFASLRATRDVLLADTDWIIIKQQEDGLLTPIKYQEWKDYRQALRDLPMNTVDPFNPVWPTKPT